eukprot:1156138-Pelagomonas_calceolata.AAC.1
MQLWEPTLRTCTYKGTPYAHPSAVVQCSYGNLFAHVHLQGHTLRTKAVYTNTVCIGQHEALYERLL